MRLARSANPERLSARLARYERLALTYPQHGASRAELPAGYHHIDVASTVGAGRGDLQRLADGLLRWHLQHAAGFVTAATTSGVEVGATVLNATRGMLGLLVPCRVVHVIEEGDRRGFAYGTLPGHPMVGEERFTAEIDSTGRVALRIVSFSRPTGLGRLAPPLVRATQDAVNRRYALAGRRLAAGPDVGR